MQTSMIDMNFHSHSLSIQTTESECIPSKISNIKTKQILLNLTDNHLKNYQTFPKSDIINNGSTRICRRRRPTSLKFSTNHRSKNTINNKNQIQIINESLNSVENFQQERNQAQLQRAMYNARQTPLIPLITDINFPWLLQSSERQDNLLINILNLLSNINEECSFFEQFKI